jgi:hypothetical protein
MRSGFDRPSIGFDHPSFYPPITPWRSKPPRAHSSTCSDRLRLRSARSNHSRKDRPMTDDVQELTTTDAKPVRERRVSPRVRHAIDLLLTGECRLKKDAAAKAGLTPERLSRALKEGHVVAYLTAQTRVLLATSQAPAAATMLRLLDGQIRTCAEGRRDPPARHQWPQADRGSRCTGEHQHPRRLRNRPPARARRVDRRDAA